MKWATPLLVLALVIITAVSVFLLRKGAALRPAGVIKPAEIGDHPEKIGEAIAVRLYPEFHSARHVLWFLEPGDERGFLILQRTLSSFKESPQPLLVDLRSKDEVPVCTEKCWYFLDSGSQVPEALEDRLKTENRIEIYVQSFDRNAEVPEKCNQEKILDLACIGPVSVREVKRKLKTPEPYFFMRRYLDHQFFLLLEKPS